MARRVTLVAGKRGNRPSAMAREHPPKNPFKPRPGALPPFLAGRDAELRAVDANILQPLRDREEPSSNAALVSPRGLGKTALSEALRILAERNGVRALDAPASELGSMSELSTATIGREAMAQVRTIERRAKKSSIGLRTPLSGSRGKTTEREHSALQGAPSVREWEVEWERQCRESPLLVMVDEAHTLDPGVAYALLNAVQSIQKRGAPLGLLLAGTPDLPHHLRSARSTFWDRLAPGMRMGLRLLSDDESAQALREPLLKMGADVDPDALDAMVRDAQGYPHFVQAWGHAACNELLDEWPSGRREVTPAHVDAARPGMDLERAELYAARRNELECAEGSPLRKPLRAYADIAEAILSADGRRLRLASVEAIVEDALADEMGEAGFSADHVGAIIQRGEHTGFIRKDPLTDEFHPGIPSLLSHIARLGAEPPLPRRKKE